MEAFRLKNIVILILAFLNLFLLGILGRHVWQERSAQRRAEAELRQLYADHGLALPEDIELVDPPPATLSMSRDLNAEAAMAAFILDEEVKAKDEGGGIYSYTGVKGIVRFRSNGAFNYTPRNHPVSSPQTLCEAFCEAFQYQVTLEDYSAQESIVTATQMAGESPIYNVFVSFLFSEGKLASLSGSYISPASSSVLQENSVTRATALVRILDYLDPSGIIYSEIMSIRPVYELQATTASPMRLAAKWEVSTDTGRYYVDCYDGSVGRG